MSTPGLSATVDGSLTGYDVQTEELPKEMRKQITRKGERQTAAAVVWIGYQAPQGVEAAGSSAAEQGGAELADFWQGLNTMRDTTPPALSRSTCPTASSTPPDPPPNRLRPTDTNYPLHN